MAGPTQTPSVPTPPAWLGRAVTKGSLFGAGLAGFLTFLPSHSVGKFVSTALIILVVLGVLRTLDPSLAPLWTVLGRIPRLARIAAGLALPWWYAVSQFGPSAAGNEVSRVRTTLVVTTVLAYVLFHSGPEPASPPVPPPPAR